MTKIWIGTLFSLILMILCWFVFSIDNFEMVRFLTTIYCAISFICFLFTGVVKQIKKNASPYCVFAVINFLIGISLFIFSIYDINDSDGWFPGLVGSILLAFVIPFIILLFIIDFVVWKKSKSKQ